MIACLGYYTRSLSGLRRSVAPWRSRLTDTPVLSDLLGPPVAPRPARPLDGL